MKGGAITGIAGLWFLRMATLEVQGIHAGCRRPLSPKVAIQEAVRT